MLDQDDVTLRYLIPQRSAPHVRVNFVASIDGAAGRDGLSGALGDADDSLVFETLRMLTDVIVVGAGTVRAEGYGGIRPPVANSDWRRAHGLGEAPPVAVVSSRLDLTPGNPLFTDSAARPFVVTCDASDLGKRSALAKVADVLVCGDTEVDPRQMVDTLAAAGYPQMLCEGGPSLFGSLIAADLVDELCLTISPVLDGGESGRISHSPVATPRSMRLAHALPAERMLFLRYLRA